MPGDSGTKLSSPAPGDFHQFGNAVAVEDSIAFVGAPYDGASGFDAGAVYVYGREGLIWSFSDQLTPPFGSSQTAFGWSLAADAGRVAVGALFTDAPGASEAGSVTLFQQVPGGSGFQQEAQLFVPDPQSNDQFGYAVALDGDTLFVGAPLDDSAAGAVDAGLVHVYEYDDAAGWGYRTVLRATNGATGDSFGIAVALDGDLAAIGSPGKDEAGPDSGAVYVARRTNGVWALDAKLVPSDGQADDLFGRSVAVSGSTVAIGAPRHGVRGAVYVFQKSGSNAWSEVAKVDPGNDNGVWDFGFSVGLEQDRMCIGAPSTGLPPQRGTALVYDRKIDGDWALTHTFSPSTAFPGDRIGWSIATDCATTLVGAPLQPDFMHFGAGAAYAFDTFPEPESFCTAKTSSSGCVGQIGAVGMPSLGLPQPFWILAAGIMNQKVGMALYSTDGPGAAPFSGATLCVQAPVHRGPLQGSNGSPIGNDCTGFFALDFKAWYLLGQDQNLFTGTQIHAQYWYRDPGDPYESGLTDGVRFLWCP